MAITKMAYSKAQGYTLRSFAREIPAGSENDAEFWIKSLDAEAMRIDPFTPYFNVNEGTKKPPKFTKDDGSSIRLMVRRDTGAIFHAPTKLFQPFQLSDLFRVVSSISPMFEMKILTAGLCGRGERAWVAMEMPSFKIGKEPTRRVFFIDVPNDGTGKVGGAGVLTTPVCDNTLAMATSEMKDSDTLTTLRHIATSEAAFSDKIEDFILKIRRSIGWFDVVKADYEALSEMPIKDGMIDALWDNVIYPAPVKTEAEEIASILASADKAASVVADVKEPITVRRRNDARDRFNDIVNQEIAYRGETRLALMQASTGYGDYGIAYQKSKTDVSERRLLNTLTGNAASMKLEALNWLKTA